MCSSVTWTEGQLGGRREDGVVSGAWPGVLEAPSLDLSRVSLRTARELRGPGKSQKMPENPETEKDGKFLHLCDFSAHQK